MAKAGAIRAGRAFVELYADNAQLQRGLKQAEARLKSFSASVSAAGQSLARIGGLITAPLLAASAVTIKLGDDLEKMSRRTGVSVEALSQLAFAAEQSGANVDAVQKAVFKMQRTIGDASRGLSTAKKALDDLGVSAEHLEGLAPEDQFKLIADRLKDMTDANRQASIGQEILGRGFRDVLPLINEGAAGIEAYQRQADALGITMTTDMARASAEMADELNIMRRVLTSVTLAVGHALLPVLKDAVQWVSENAQRWREWIEENERAIRIALKVGAAITALGVGLIVLGKIVGGVAVGVGVLNTALLFLSAHPIIAAMTIIAAGFVAVAMAVGRAERSVSAYADAVAQANAASEKQRDADRDRLDRLAELSAKQELSNDEMREAANLIAILEGRYGELGLILDDTTRKLENLAEAQRNANREMLKQQFGELLDEMEARRAAVAELERQIALREGVIERNPNNSRETIKTLQREREELAEQLRLIEEIHQRITALRTGGDSTDASPGNTSSDAFDAVDELNTEAERWARRVHQLRLEQIEDELQREIELLNERYDHELKLAGDNAEAIKQIEQARELELERIRDAHRQRRLDEDKRAAEEAAREQERIDRLNQNQQRTVQELRLRTTLEGRELEEELLNLRERQAIEDAERQGQDLDLVREEFELRRQMLAQQQQVAEAMSTFSSIGSFATDGMQRIIGEVVGLAGEFGADADEETARNTNTIAELMQSTDDQVRLFVSAVRSGEFGLVVGP